MFDEIIAPLFTTEWGRRASWGAMICLALALLWGVLATFSTWYSDFRLIHGASREVKSSLATDEMKKLVTQIPDQHIFGQAGVLARGATLPITSLQLRLVGVVKAVPEKFSRVIISEGGKPGKVYQVGDSLSSGVRIYAIAPDGVVLENGGRFEKLPLQRAPLLFQGMPKSLYNNENTQEE